MPVAIDVHLLHLIRLNFFSKLPYTAESDLLLSPLCAAIGDELYEIGPNTRTLLLQKLFERHTIEHIQRLA